MVCSSINDTKVVCLYLGLHAIKKDYFTNANVSPFQFTEGSKYEALVELMRHNVAEYPE